jgi:hypothetical protein
MFTCGPSLIAASYSSPNRVGNCIPNPDYSSLRAGKAESLSLGMISSFTIPTPETKARFDDWGQQWRIRSGKNWRCNNSSNLWRISLRATPTVGNMLKAL